MRTRKELEDETKEMLRRATTGDSLIGGMQAQMLELLLDIRDLLANPPEENFKQEVRCKECQNDNHGGCTGCICHADY